MSISAIERRASCRAARRSTAPAAPAPPPTRGCGASDAELLASAGSAGCATYVDRRQRVCPLGRPVLERQPPRLLEEHVDHDPLRRRQDHRVDELLALVAAAVAADELHPRARQCDVEHARVRGVGQVEANDLAALRAQREVGLAADEQHVAEPPHRRVGRLGAAERRDLPVLDQDVVERQQRPRGAPAASSRGRPARRGCSRKGPSPGRSPRGCAGGTSRRPGSGNSIR